MAKYKVGLQLIGKASAIIVLNSIKNEIVYESWIQTEDIIDFFKDLSIPVIGTVVKISKRHPSLIELKNMGYSISEIT